MPSPPSGSKNVVEYQLTAREIVGEWFRLRMLRPKTILIYGGLFALGLAVVISNHRLLIGWVLLAFPVIFAFVFRLALQRVVKQNPAMTAPRSISFDSNGVVFASATSRNRYQWSEIRRFSESGEYYVFQLADHGSVANIPKASFTEEQREAFLSCTQSIAAKRS